MSGEKIIAGAQEALAHAQHVSRLKDLLNRVQSTTGPDRELDGRIMFGLFAKPIGQNGFIWPEDSPSWAFAFRFSKSAKEARKGIGEETIEWQEPDGSWILMNSLRVPKLTASLDAAVALVERRLPGWLWKLGSAGLAKLTPEQNSCVAPPEYEGDADTPALALLAALLRACINQEGGGND